MAYVGGFAGIIFSVTPQQILTFKNLNRKTRHIFSEHKIINSATKLESVGIEAAEVTFEIQLLQGLGVEVAKLLKDLHEVCRLGLVDFLIIGGENFGEYVLESVEESVEHTDGRGRTIAATAKLTLKEYNG